MIFMYVCVRLGAGLMGCLARLMSSTVMEVRLNSLACLSSICKAKHPHVEVSRPEDRSAKHCALAAAGLSWPESCQGLPRHLHLSHKSAL